MLQLTDVFFKISDSLIARLEVDVSKYAFKINVNQNIVFVLFPKISMICDTQVLSIVDFNIDYNLLIKKQSKKITSIVTFVLVETKCSH